jgi:hypothetical protein
VKLSENGRLEIKGPENGRITYRLTGRGMRVTHGTAISRDLLANGLLIGGEDKGRTRAWLIQLIAKTQTETNEGRQ